MPVPPSWSTRPPAPSVPADAALTPFSAADGERVPFRDVKSSSKASKPNKSNNVRTVRSRRAKSYRVPSSCAYLGDPALGLWRQENWRRQVASHRCRAVEAAGDEEEDEEQGSSRKRRGVAAAVPHRRTPVRRARLSALMHELLNASSTSYCVTVEGREDREKIERKRGCVRVGRSQ